MSEDEATRGLTLRELTLLIHNDVQEIKQKYPSRAEIYSVLVILISVGGAIVSTL